MNTGYLWQCAWVSLRKRWWWPLLAFVAGSALSLVVDWPLGVGLGVLLGVAVTAYVLWDSWQRHAGDPEASA